MEHPKNKPYIVIMAGGGGTRLWPKSRQSVPKQFLPLFSHKTLLQETYSRIAPLTDNDHIFVVAPKKYKEEILSEIPDLTEENLIIEPLARSTAAAMGLACMYIRKRDPEAIVHFLPADAYIVEIGEFQRVLITASIIAENRDDILVWGVHPTRAATEYGYIQSGDDVEEVNGLSIFKVKGFREKPNLATAQAFVASGKYFWNGGIYSQKASLLLAAIEKHMGDLWTALTTVSKTFGTDKYEDTAMDVFTPLESIAIDTGVTEKIKNLLMIPASYTWSDVGSWDALYDIADKNEGTNSVLTEVGEHIGYDTHGCLIHTDGKMLATIGLSDMIIIDTPDVLMICPKSRSQDVKKMVELLKERSKTEFL